MSGTTWVRGWTDSQPWGAGSQLLAKVPHGATLLRTRYGWSASGTTSVLDSAPNIMTQLLTFGLVTTDSTLVSAPPNAATGQGDAAPPVQRWLWWEARQLRPVTWGSRELDVVTWGDVGPAEPTDSKSQVVAAVGAGGTLDVWLSWAPTGGTWPELGFLSISMWWSLLYQS